MKLSKRLKAIADMIPVDKNVIDVGCDHALLDIYLAKTRPSISVTATDINTTALEKAKKTAMACGVLDQITFKNCNGLTSINIKKEDIIVIAGMGAYTMSEILLDASLYGNTLVLSAHKNVECLRRHLCKQGYYIEKEEVIFDKKWYFILTFVKGERQYEEFDYIIGPFAKHNQKYMEYLYQREQRVSDVNHQKTAAFILLEKMKTVNN